MNTYTQLQNKDCNYIIRIMLVGNSKTGKSTILKSLTGYNFYDSYEQTIGVEFSTNITNISHGKEKGLWKIYFWDTSGNNHMKSINKKYYNIISIVLIVCDIYNKDSFESIPLYISEVLEKNSEVYFHLVANKYDNIPNLNNKRISDQQIQEYANKNNLNYNITSCKLGKGICNLIPEIINGFSSSQFWNRPNSIGFERVGEDDHNIKTRDYCCDCWFC